LLAELDLDLAVGAADHPPETDDLPPGADDDPDPPSGTDLDPGGGFLLEDVPARDLRIVPLVHELEDETGTGRFLVRLLDARADETGDLDRGRPPGEAEDPPEPGDPRDPADEPRDREAEENAAPSARQRAVFHGRSGL
jgi:hypothetical protein